MNLNCFLDDIIEKTNKSWSRQPSFSDKIFEDFCWQFDKLTLYLFVPFFHVFGVLDNLEFSWLNLVINSLLLFLLSHFFHLLSLDNFFLLVLLNLLTKNFLLFSFLLLFFPSQVHAIVDNILCGGSVEANFPGTFTFVHASREFLVLWLDFFWLWEFLIVWLHQLSNIIYQY